MDPAPLLRSRPGWFLRGSSIFGLASWLGILLLLSTVPGIGLGTVLSAMAMAGLFAVLLVTQGASSVHAGPEGLLARTLLRVVACRWDGVRKVEVRQLLPGLRYYVVTTTSGPVVFSSLWTGHRQLFETLRERGGLA